MRSANLANLESLSEEQKDQSRKEAEVLRDEVNLLNQQHHSLKSINDDYQNSMVGAEAVPPQILAHRRAFVEQLSRKLDVLKTESQRQSRLLVDKEQVCQQHAAQTAAIGSMVEREIEEEKRIVERQEQRQQDESVASSRQFRLIDKESVDD